MNSVRFVVAETEETCPGTWRVRVQHNLDSRLIIVGVTDDEGFLLYPGMTVIDDRDQCTLFFDHDPRGLKVAIHG